MTEHNTLNMVNFFFPKQYNYKNMCVVFIQFFLIGAIVTLSNVEVIFQLYLQTNYLDSILDKTYVLILNASTTILLAICQICVWWCVLTRFWSVIDLQLVHFTYVCIFNSKGNMFVNVKWINLFWKFKDIKCLIIVLKLSEY